MMVMMMPTTPISVALLNESVYSSTSPFPLLYFHSLQILPYLTPRYAEMMRILTHLKPECPPSRGALIAGTRLDSGRRAFIPHLSDTAKGALSAGEAPLTTNPAAPGKVPWALDDRRT